eukprot:1137556-Pelagomonas_calceolata.AAC.6
MSSSYLLSTTKGCTLDAAADHKHKPVEQPLDPQKKKIVFGLLRILKVDDEDANVATDLSPSW